MLPHLGAEAGGYYLPLSGCERILDGNNPKEEVCGSQFQRPSILSGGEGRGRGSNHGRGAHSRDCSQHLRPESCE